MGRRLGFLVVDLPDDDDRDDGRDDVRLPLHMRLAPGLKARGSAKDYKATFRGRGRVSALPSNVLQNYFEAPDEQH